MNLHFPMVPLFLGLTLTNLLALGITLLLGYAVHRDPAYWGTWHQLTGVLSTLTCVAVHCIVVTYFIATAKWIQHAVTLKHLDAALTLPTRSFKAQAFPAALGAMAIVFITAITGVVTFGGQDVRALHHALAIGSVIVNALVAVVEYRAIVRNGRLIDTILGRIAPVKSV